MRCVLYIPRMYRHQCCEELRQSFSRLCIRQLYGALLESARKICKGTAKGSWQERCALAQLLTGELSSVLAHSSKVWSTTLRMCSSLILRLKVWKTTLSFDITAELLPVSVSLTNHLDWSCRPHHNRRLGRETCQPRKALHAISHQTLISERTGIYPGWKLLDWKRREILRIGLKRIHFLHHFELQRIPERKIRSLKFCS